MHLLHFVSFQAIFSIRHLFSSSVVASLFMVVCFAHKEEVANMAFGKRAAVAKYMLSFKSRTLQHQLTLPTLQHDKVNSDNKIYDVTALDDVTLDHVLRHDDVKLLGYPYAAKSNVQTGRIATAERVNIMGSQATIRHKKFLTNRKLFITKLIGSFL